EAMRPERAHPSAEAWAPVLATTRVVEPGLGPLGRLFDQAVGEHARDRAVQRARAHADVPVAHLFDVAHDAVAVLLAVHQRHEDVQRGRRQRHEPFRPLGAAHPRSPIYRYSMYRLSI